LLGFLSVLEVQALLIYTFGAVQTYLFMTWRSSAFVVRSIDLTMTLVLDVIGNELASLSGLKVRTADMILFAMDGRVFMRLPALLRVAVTSNASLWPVRYNPAPQNNGIFL